MSPTHTGRITVNTDIDQNDLGPFDLGNYCLLRHTCPNILGKLRFYVVFVELQTFQSFFVMHTKAPKHHLLINILHVDQIKIVYLILPKDSGRLV